MLDMELSSSITAHFSTRPCDFCRTNVDAALSVSRKSARTGRLRGNLDWSIRELVLVLGKSMKISIRRFGIERFSVTSSSPFEAVVTTLKEALGRLYLVELAKVSEQAGAFTELKEVIDRNAG